MKKVLVVDDSVMWREFLKRLISDKGHSVEVASDGLEGYNKAFEFVPDVIFTDVVMPKLNGYHLCRLLKNTKTFKRTGIIIMTTFEESLSRFWAYKSGADGFMQKSSVEEIERDIEKYLSIEGFKADWKNIGVEPRQPFMELSSLLDNLLLKETVKSEIYSLYSFVNNEDHVFWKLSDLAFDVLSIDALALLVLNPQVGTVFANSKSGTFNSLYLREKLFSVLSKPTIPTSWTYKGSVSMSGDLNIEDLSVYVISDGEEEVGSFGIISRGLNEDEAEILEELVDNMGRLFKLTAMYSMTVNMARYDELTGLNNYRTLMEKLSEYFSLSKRQGLPFSVLMVDIDHFKRVNDTYGHLTGNEVLKRLASIMRESFRSTDVIGRYGGEEFTVGLVDANVKESEEAAERFRKNVESYGWSGVKPDLRITVSIGLTSTDVKDYRTVVEMIEDADEALYVSKRSGRNRVTVYEEVWR